MEMRPWKDMRVLIAGCGSIGKRHASVLNRLGISDMLLYDPDEAQMASLMQEVPCSRPYKSYELALAERPDAVFVLTPTQYHIPMAVQAIEADAHVFIEKPLSDSMEGIPKLKALATQKHRKVMVGFCFRYHEGIVKAKKLVEEGKIGRLVSIRSLMGEHLPDVRSDYKTLFSSTHTGAFDLIHDLDLALWFAGQPCRKIHCIYGTFSDIGIIAPDIVEILLGFEDRCVAAVHLDFFQSPRRRQFELLGTLGTIIVEFSTWDAYTISVYMRASDKWDVSTCPAARDDMFLAEDGMFLHAVTADEELLCDIDEACSSLKVLDEVYFACE